MVEEAADVARHVEGHELVDGSRRQAPRQDGGRGAGARGHEDGDAAAGQPLREGQEGERLAHARAVHPHERAARPGPARAAAALGQARALLQAPAPAPGQEAGGRGLQERERDAIGQDGPGEGAGHGAVSRSPAPGSRAPTSA
jgi:hypothetical protein